ncbi:hypothetical protein ZWY2020_006473 [Hordeum vulgare]|nr:hypothetical protein ZWY2020_006473 [Hordeum vulgare]
MDTAVRTKRLETERGYTLPEEIVEDILSHLPVRSLHRFRCVNRTWHALITSPAFKNLHSDRSRRDGGHRRLFLKPTCRNVFYAWKLGGAVETIMDNWRLPPGEIFPITKSCHGIVLLRCLHYDLHYVWNPSANELLTLPDRTPARVAWTGGRTHVIYGMGHCSTTKQYKIVRMYNFRHDHALHVHDTVCEVYTLDESTHWRPAATQPPSCQLRVNGRQGAVLCNGNLHFVHKHGLDLLTVFNIHAETFSTMVLPPEVRPCSPDFMLTELDGSLCVYHAKDRDRRDFADPYDIWLLRDYEAGKWKRLRCINWESMGETEMAPLKSSWIAPLDMYYDHGAGKKKILFGTGACKVFVVDPDIGVPQVIFSPEDTIMGDQGNWDSQLPTIGLFEERLASVGRTNEEIIFTSPWARVASQVLMHLPARTVGRLNQVCKGWRAMIKADCFVGAHLYHANLDKIPHIMFTDGTPCRFKALEDFINTSDALPPLIDEGSRVAFSKPCNGLNTGSLLKYDFLCNPLTKYYRAVKLDNGENAASYFSDSANGLFGHVALGYAPNIEMHVLVSLAYKEKNRTSRDYKLECKIQLIQRRDWVQIDPPSRPIADVPPVYASGKLYWIVDPNLVRRRLAARS